MEKLVLIDGNSLINRAFYAMPVLLTKDGVPTNAVYGFMNMFFKMLSEVKPDYVAVAFDLKAPTFRHKMYDGYKATRKPMPDDLRPQIPLLKEVLKLMGVAVYEKEGSEADDIIGTIAKHTSIQTYIYTGDKDALQLVDGETTVYFTRRGITDIEEYTINNFTEKTTLVPSQIIELKALMGDSSDNIPGVKGVGEKTALTLLQEYKTVENVYKNVGEIKGKLQEKLIENEQTAYLSKKLATIDTDCGVDTNVDNMRIKTPFPLAVKEKFRELEFKTLFNREELFDQTSVEEGGNDYSLEKIERKTVASKEELSVFSKEKLTALNFSSSEITIYFGTGVEYVVPIRKTLLDDGFSLSEAFEIVKEYTTSGANVIVFNKKDVKRFLLDDLSAQFTAHAQDLSLVKYLVSQAGGSQTLEDLLSEYGYQHTYPAYAIYSIYDQLYKKLKEDGLTSLYEEVELPLSDVLFEMENAGFKVDIGALNTASEKYAEILKGLESEIRALAENETLNVNSPKQLGEVLFEKLKIGKGKKTKSGYSTSADVLEGLEGAHAIVPLILKHRQIQKLQSTYVEGFKPLIDKKTGLIHTSFNQTVTATGRLSSKEPNLQNIPVRDDEGKEIRKMFVARGEDRVLISADYSQIELRLLSAFSNCEPLISAFNSGRDVHAETASKVFNVPLSEVTSQMRRSAKAVNFGIIYGISEYGLAKNIKTSNQQAREYIKTYFETYPEVKAYMDENVRFAKEHGYSETVLKRKRYIRELQSSSYPVRQFGERVAMNMPLQGSSADVIKKAMIAVSNRIKSENLKSQLILQVHDELIVDAFESEKEIITKILKEEMENAVSLKVKLTVEIGVGKTWFEAK